MFLIGVLEASPLIAGAVATDGQTLFEQGNYREARQVLRAALSNAPDDPQNQFYLGRTYLALEEADRALPHLVMAAKLAPENAVYHFWLGVNYWALLDLDRELAAYDRALAIDPGFLPAHVYAGHNQLDRGQWEAALGHYREVLQVQPMHGEALYNAGLALQALDWEKEAVAAWLSYLRHHRTGRLALSAARLLNGAGDFSYRAFPIGKRFVVGPSPGFRGDTLDMGSALIETLDDIGRYIQANETLDLHVVAFVKNDARLAEERARTAKRYIRANFPDIPPRRVHISWFDHAQTILTGKRNDNQKASLNFFTARTGREDQ